VAHRKHTRLQRFTREAHFPFFKTIEEFDFNAGTPDHRSYRKNHRFTGVESGVYTPRGNLFALTEDLKPGLHNSGCRSANALDDFSDEKPPLRARNVFAGSSVRSKFPITKGWCSPAFLAKVYDRSNPFGSPGPSFPNDHSPENQRSTPAILRPVAQSVFDERLSFGPDAEITDIP
jgi:hypothetical protein